MNDLAINNSKNGASVACAQTGGLRVTTGTADAGENCQSLAPDLSLTGRMLSLAVGSLILAGCFSFLLVVGRTPVLSGLISDPLFFKRGLVIHVDLALIVWFFSFAAALFSLLPAESRNHRVFQAGFRVALTGIGGMVLGALVPGAAPVLCNYVPVIDHPLYVLGLALFFGGLLICFMDGRLFAPAETPPNGAGNLVSPDAAVGLKAVAVAYLLAMTSFAVSWQVTPRILDARTYYELVFWGGGHVLQVANVAAMLAVWLLLLSSLLRRPVMSARTSGILFTLLLLPHMVAPVLALQGTIASVYRLGFTRLMQFGIFPVVTVFLIICTRRLWRALQEREIGAEAWRDPRFIGFCASAALTVTGFLLGGAIRDANTMIPAHYHASIGAVTVGFMAVTYLLLDPLGWKAGEDRIRRLIPYQLYLFGGGQVIFALGFGWGGFHGLGRKAYGAEQHVRSMGEYVGLGVMGLGGLIAIGGGVLFLALVVRAGRPRLFPMFPSLNANPQPGAAHE